MRLVFMNPHTHTFGRSVSGFLFRRKDFFKYEYFIEYIIKKEGRAAFLVDGTRTSFNGIGLSFLFSFKIFAFLELFIWMILNKINPLSTKVYLDIKKLDVRNDILFDFSRSISDAVDLKKIVLNKFNGITLIHFTHYFKDIKKLSEYINKIPNYVIVAENNLAHNEYFKKFFPFVKNTYHLPFSFGKRFIFNNKTRINKCLAIGSITKIKNNEFLDFFGDSEGLHPMRKIIFKNSNIYREELDSYIRGFDNTSNVRKINKQDSIVTKLIKKYLPFFILEKFYPTSQINYFKFDIVNKFNQYKMFICPEESVGLPSINVFEGMACQCAYIGIDSPIYTNLGLVPGVHYITYKEDDFEDFILKVRYYQNNPNELEKIAVNGYNFVLENFNSKNIADAFWNDLEKISEKFSTDKKVELCCRFKKQ